VNGGEVEQATSHTPSCVGWDSENIGLPYRLPGLGDLAAHSSCSHPIKWAHFEPINGEWHWRSERRRGCRRFDCPVSVRPDGARWGNRWLTREVAVAASRLPRTVIHAVLSPEGANGPMHAHVWVATLRKLRAAARAALRSAYPGRRILGLLVCHPERCVDSDRLGGHGSLHFHAALVPCGSFDGRAVKRQHQRTGWVVKVLGARKTRQLLAYEFHHAGRWLRPHILPNALANSAFATEAITWFCVLNNAATPENQGILCPICRETIPGRDWQEVVWGREPGPGSDGTSGRAPEGSMVSVSARRFADYTERY